MAKQEINQALYLAHRPQRFADVIGQDPIVGTLKRAIAVGKVGHAYLFTGPRGTGKTTTARILAKAINCQKPKAGEPDASCPICNEIAEGNLMDVLEIDAASNRGIDEIRELRDKVGYAPTKAARKIYIIDEAHMLTKEAWGALLKTLEEPPSHVTFILATTEPQKVPATIISRCQRFDFKPATTAQLAEYLETIAKSEGLKLKPDAAELIARHARGGYRDALSVLDLLASVDKGTITADTVREVLGLAHLTAVAGLERALVARDRAAALGIIRESEQQGISAELFRTAVIDYLRALLLAKVDGGKTPTQKKAAELAADWTTPQPTQAIRAYVEAGDLAAAAVVPELPLELATLDLLEALAPEGPAPKLATAQAEEALKQVASSRAPSKPKPTKTTDPVKPPANAQELWEKLLISTKDQYSLSVSLQKTRPIKLTKDTFELTVQSEFFRDKLAATKTKPALEKRLSQLAGRDLKLKLSLAEPETEDVFDAALKVFEGAEVE